MRELVSARTITDLTLSAASGSVKRRPPTPEELKQHTSRALHTRNHRRKKKIDGKKLSSALKDFEKASADKRHERALANQQLMERIMGSPPDGFEFVPIVFTRISKEQNQEVMREFSKKVRPCFMQFLAKSHAADLRKMGICDHGIERMKNGFDPADEKGRVYDVSVDHIIERAGSGKFGLEKAVDPLMPPGSPPTFKVNHFANFILIPQKLHNLKNTINAQQSVSERAEGTSTWCYMLVPADRTPENPRFVHAPGTPAPNPYNVLFRDLKSEDLIGHASYIIDRLMAVLPGFLEHEDVKIAVETTNDIFESSLPLSASKMFGPDFSGRVFESVLNGGGPLTESYRKKIKPLFEDLRETLKLFERRNFDQGNAGHRELTDFINLVEGKRMVYVMEALDVFPPGVLDKPRQTLHDLKCKAEIKRREIGARPRSKKRGPEGP